MIRSLIGWLGPPDTQIGIVKIWLLALAISLAIAAAAYHWVEHPLERVLRRAGPGGARRAGPAVAPEPDAGRTAEPNASAPALPGPEKKSVQ
ncbi:hypothetical protein ACFWMX_02375 [Streptomyces sp. NPDC058378]|uniref:hypothetical protein n=1 Tax=Streptomyces sp. NPDC058378 TaxID=3346469 RepID=UPI003656D250